MVNNLWNNFCSVIAVTYVCRMTYNLLLFGRESEMKVNNVLVHLLNKSKKSYRWLIGLRTGFWLKNLEFFFMQGEKYYFMQGQIKPIHSQIELNVRWMEMIFGSHLWLVVTLSTILDGNHYQKSQKWLPWLHCSTLRLATSTEYYYVYVNIQLEHVVSHPRWQPSLKIIKKWLP